MVYRCTSCKIVLPTERFLHMLHFSCVQVALYIVPKFCDSIFVTSMILPIFTKLLFNILKNVQGEASNH